MNSECDLHNYKSESKMLQSPDVSSQINRENTGEKVGTFLQSQHSRGWDRKTGSSRPAWASQEDFIFLKEWCFKDASKNND